MVDGFLWFQGTFAQFLVVYKSWEKDNIQPDLSEVRLPARETAVFDISCL